jgi:hypothetical protein
MTKHGWHITHDFISEPLSDYCEPRVGYGWGDAGGELLVFLFDDDGILYYIAEAWTEADAVEAHDFAAQDAGVTGSWVDAGNGLEPFVG